MGEDEDEILYELVKPEIIETAGEQTGAEGCLSVPGVFGEVTRPGIREGPGPGPGRRGL